MNLINALTSIKNVIDTPIAVCGSPGTGTNWAVQQVFPTAVRLELNEFLTEPQLFEFFKANKDKTILVDTGGFFNLPKHKTLVARTILIRAISGGINLYHEGEDSFTSFNGRIIITLYHSELNSIPSIVSRTILLVNS